MLTVPCRNSRRRSKGTDHLVDGSAMFQGIFSMCFQPSIIVGILIDDVSQVNFVCISVIVKNGSEALGHVTVIIVLDLIEYVMCRKERVDNCVIQMSLQARLVCHGNGQVAMFMVVRSSLVEGVVHLVLHDKQ
jgi:hypothetical protein